MTKDGKAKSKPAVRCAIYTRKSSDEGLEQEFNSLDAQRAAGEAYVISQASEGWTLIPAHYDDGGYSGGTMDTRVAKAALSGKLFDANGEAMSPSFSRGRSGQIYRYYVSASLQQGGDNHDDGIVRRLPASAIETIAKDTAARWLPRAKDPLASFMAVRVAEHGLVFEADGKLADGISQHLQNGEQMVYSSAKLCRIHVPIILPLRGGQRLIIAESKPDIRPDPALIAALRRAHSLLQRDRKGMPVLEVSPPQAYNRNLIRLAFLAPDIQRDILKGRQPASLNLQQLVKMDIPLCWNEQRKVLNWPNTK